ncbi:hypothetical protein KA025_03650 [Candidatus Saccharibacteria bacterium]|jgi:hypothetical protein|nr:hypothetical protein [Candidatus Saccharibacteria bacterium]
MNDYLNRAGRPATQSAARVVNDQQPGVQGGGQAPKKKKLSSSLGKVLAVIVAVVLVVLVVGGAYYALVANKDGISSKIQTDKYQAVFLNSADGQVYFGKLKVLNDRYYELSNIYYVRVEQVQPDKNTTETKQNISLAKLGNEIHGPQDIMYVNRDSVMFWENLKDDGQVVKAINDYIKNGQKPATTNP